MLDDLSEAEAVEGLALSLEGVDDIKSSDGLSLGVFGVGDWVSHDVLQECSENVSGLLVDEGWDSLDTSSSCESSDCWLGDSHDGLFQWLLGVSLGADFAVAFAYFASSYHFELIVVNYY